MTENSSTLTPAAEPAVLSQDQDILTAAKGGGFIFFGHLFDYASRFIFGIIIARALGADGFGIYIIGVTVATTLGSLAVLGLEAGIVHFLPAAIFRDDESSTRGTLQVGLLLTTIAGLGLGLFVFGLAGFLARNIFQELATVPVLRWIAITIPLISIGRVLMAATRAFKNMQYQVYANTIAFNVVRIGLAVVFLSLGMGITGAMAAYAIAWLISDVLSVIFLNRIFPLKGLFRAAHRQTREILTFSVPVCLDLAVRQVGGSFEILLLGTLTTVAIVGIYSASVRIQMVGVMFLMTAEMVAKPIISELYHRREIIQLERIYQTLTRWSLAFILPYLLTVVLYAGPILSIFGDEFKVGAPVLIIVSLGTLVNAGTGICGAMIVMTGHSRLTFLNSMVGVILNLILNLILIPMWGLIGAAVATALAISIVNLLRLLQVYKLFKLWPYHGEFIKPWIAIAITLGAVLVTNLFLPDEQTVLSPLFSIALLWSAYLVVLFLMGLTREDKLVLSHSKQRIRGMLGWSKEVGQ